jgi:hypothetical protein
MDDAYLGGKRKGKRGCEAAGKVPFLAAVGTTEVDKPRRMKLYPVPSFTGKVISKAVISFLKDECMVFTDGLSCFGVVSYCCFTQIPLQITGNKELQDSAFKWVNTVLGNVKCALVGTYRAIAGKHVPRYHASFAYRFNRRFSLLDLFLRLAYVALRTPSMPYRFLKLAEYYT